VSDEFLTVADVAERLKLNQQTVRNWIDRGELAAHHVGRRVRIRREDFDALLQAGYTTSRRSDPTTGAAASLWDGVVPEPVAPTRY